MHLKYRLPLVLISSLAFSVSSLHAQDDDEDEEEFGSMGFFNRAPQAVNVALKMTKGPQVQFGNLGSVPMTVTDTSVGINGRGYMDGKIVFDGPRAAEVIFNGSNQAPSNGRYYTYKTPGDPTSTVTGDYTALVSGVTREWEYVNPSQASLPGYIGFNVYSAESQGQSMTGSRGYTGGIELSVSRNLTNPLKRVHFSLTAGISLAGINSSINGQVKSRLKTYTDYYQVTDGTWPALTGTDAIDGVTYRGGNGTTTTNADGSSLFTEKTQTISQNPDASLHVDDSETDGAEVDGNWKVKGAYFTFKVGPQVTAMVTRSLGLTAGIGVSGSLVGTTYTTEESFSVEGVEQPILTGVESSTKSKFLSGYYANLDAIWAVNGRTGFFAGLSYEKSGEYTQRVSNRTAKIDLGSTAGVRGGLNIKF